jgi:hypothetical protein
VSESERMPPRVDFGEQIDALREALVEHDRLRREAHAETVEKLRETNDQLREIKAMALAAASKAAITNDVLLGTLGPPPTDGMVGMVKDHDGYIRDARSFRRGLMNAAVVAIISLLVMSVGAAIWFSVKFK